MGNFRGELGNIQFLPHLWPAPSWPEEGFPLPSSHHRETQALGIPLDNISPPHHGREVQDSP